MSTDKIMGMLLLACIALSCGCVENGAQGNRYPILDRDGAIPANATKMTPSADGYPPQLHSGEYEAPVPLARTVNTAGAEDSPFIPAGSGELYFFFTPDVKVPVEKQILDGVTGIYVSRWADGGWGEPERVLLQDAGKLSLDGCEFVSGNTMLFCSAREGYSGIHWFSATLADGGWSGWANSDFDPAYQVGELHITDDGNRLYFHSSREGGSGGLDIGVSERADGKWQPPENVGAVNTAGDEGWPYLTPDGGELWFTRTYMGSPAVLRSRSVNGEWQDPELILSQFAGEPTLDDEGNIYFVHHYYKDGVMIEADIYMAHRK